MPALDIFTEQVQQPILLELSGGSKLWAKEIYTLIHCLKKTLFLTFMYFMWND
jgi:hypothetical protein